MRLRRFIILIILLGAAQVSNAAAQAVSSRKYNKYALTNSGASNISSNTVTQLGFNPKRGQIWLGTGKGLNFTTGGGKNYSQINTFPRFNQNGIFALAVRSDTIWLSTAYTSSKQGNPVTGDGMMFSLDGGSNWESLPQPLDKPNDTVQYYGINALKALPIIVPEQNVIYDLAIGPRPGMVWAATWSGGIRRSMDNGKTWERVVLPPTGKQTVAPTDTLKFILEPKRGSGGDLVFLGFSTLASSDGAVWVGTVDGLCKSVDAAAAYPSWVKFNRAFGGLSGNWVTAIKEQPPGTSRPRAILAATWPAEDSREYYEGKGYQSSFTSWLGR